MCFSFVSSSDEAAATAVAGSSDRFRLRLGKMMLAGCVPACCPLLSTGGGRTSGSAPAAAPPPNNGLTQAAEGETKSSTGFNTMALPTSMKRVVVLEYDGEEVFSWSFMAVFVTYCECVCCSL